MVEAFFIFSSIMGGGMIGMFFLGLLTRRCSKKGLYIGLFIGVIFIAWATITNNPKLLGPSTLPWLPRFTINILWLGLLGNIVVFTTGYLASLVFSPRYNAEEGLTIYRKTLPEAEAE